MMANRYFVINEKCQNLFQKIHQANLPLKIEFRRKQICKSFISYILKIQDKILTLSLPVSTEDNSSVVLKNWEKEITIFIDHGNLRYIFYANGFKQSHLVLDSDELKQTMLILIPTLVEAYPLHSAERIYTVPEIVVKIYGLDNKADISSLFDEPLQGVIHDLSAGGIGVSITKKDLSKIRVGDLFQLCFVPVPNEEPLLLNARLRHVTDLNRQQHVLLGFQFTVQTLTEGSGNMLHRLNHIVKLYRTLEKKHQLKSS